MRRGHLTIGHALCAALLGVGSVAVSCAAAPTARATTARAEPAESAPDPRADVRAKLASTNFAQIAWGAWQAAESGERDLAGDVHAALRRTLAAPVGAEQSFALRAELDALIRLDAHLEAEDLSNASRVACARNQTLVLAARNPRLHAPMLETLRASAQSEELVAIDNLLAIGAPGRLTELLLPEARLHVTVHVHDPNSGSGEGGSRRSRIACGSVQAPEGFPPVVLYDLVLGRIDDGSLIADGPQPVSFRRTTRSESKFGVGRTARDVPVNDHALSLLRWIVGDRSPTSLLEGKIRIVHIWKDPAHYVADVHAQLDERRTAWRELTGKLAAAGSSLRNSFRSTRRSTFPWSITARTRASRCRLSDPSPGAERTRDGSARAGCAGPKDHADGFSARK